jgi:dsDNA-binding SOS-regulon protein
VAEESEASQTPPDLAALLALAVCSSGIARRVVVTPRPGWDEPTNLFVCVLLDSANRKSGVFTDATKPLREAEKELIESAAPAVAKAQSERRRGEARLNKLEKRIADKFDPVLVAEADELAESLAIAKAIVRPRLLVDDATEEKLSMMLAEQGGRLASMAVEGNVFDLMAGKYGKNGTTQFGMYLRGHSGDELIVDRVGRDSVRVERPALTCAYAIQPSVVEGLAGNPDFRGRGLLARFLYACPRSWIGSRKIAQPPVPKQIRDAYWATVRTLALLEGEYVLTFSPAAESLFRQWETELELSLADGGAMEMIRDWGAKLAGATARLAAVLHCVEHSGPAGEVEPRTIEAAIKIARYLTPHAESVLHKMVAGDSAKVASDAEYVLRWIVRHERESFTKSEAQHHGKRRFPKATDIDLALAELVNRNYIRPIEREASGPGRPGSPTYEVNLSIYASRERTNCGNNGNTLGDSESSKRKTVTL